MPQISTLPAPNQDDVCRACRIRRRRADFDLDASDDASVIIRRPVLLG